MNDLKSWMRLSCSRSGLIVCAGGIALASFVSGMRPLVVLSRLQMMWITLGLCGCDNPPDPSFIYELRREEPSKPSHEPGQAVCR